MKKLLAKLKNTPRNTPQVPCSVNSCLNREEILSDKSKVLTNNTLDEGLLQHRGEPNKKATSVSVNVCVYIQNINGLPLMPTSPAKARKLLQKGEANVISYNPFTIKMTKHIGSNRQSIELDVDSGYLHIGLSAKTNKKELFSAEVLLRDDIVRLLSEKRMYRRNRRGRNKPYRESRFNNRGIPKGWLAPSIKHKLDTHVRVIDKMYKLLPITSVNIEVGTFDIQKIKDPDISGKEYQQGEQLNYENVRQYVLARDNYKCQNPSCKCKNSKLQVHHKVTRMTGGNRPDNYITLCEKCHKLYHLGKLKLDIKIKDGYKAEAFMNIVRLKIVEELQKRYSNVNATYGYITNFKRKELRLEKSHINDAFAIGNGNNQIRCKPFIIKQRRRNNRCLQINRKGYKPSIRRQRYKYRPGDFVIIDKKKYEVVGVCGYGKSITVRDNCDKFDFSTKKIEKHYFSKGLSLI